MISLCATFSTATFCIYIDFREMINIIEKGHKTDMIPDLYIVISEKKKYRNNERNNKLKAISNEDSICSLSVLPLIMIEYDSSDKKNLVRSKLVSE